MPCALCRVLPTPGQKKFLTVMRSGSKAVGQSLLVEIVPLCTTKVGVFILQPQTAKEARVACTSLGSWPQGSCSPGQCPFVITQENKNSWWRRAPSRAT